MAFDAAKAPRAIRRAIVNAMRQSAGIVKDRVISTLNRRLKRRTGTLTSSIYARAGQSRFGGYLQVGTPVLYGRFWEYGFLRGGKSLRGLVRGAGRSHRRRTEAQKVTLIGRGAKLYQRPFLRPAVEQSQAEVARRIQIEVDRAVKQQFESVTIDLNIAF
jgi:hypothetical protein